MPGTVIKRFAQVGNAMQAVNTIRQGKNYCLIAENIFRMFLFPQRLPI